MSSIEIIKLENGWAVKFPFDLKDNFRESFKSAKWNRELKQWEVGRNSKTRLEQWANIHNEEADLLIEMKSEQEKHPFSKFEIQEMIKESQKNKRDLEEEVEILKKKNFNLDRSKSLLDEIESSIKLMKEEIKKETEEKLRLIEEQKKRMDGIIDIRKIRNAQELMNKIREMDYKFKEEKVQYWNAQKVIEEQMEKLDQLGLYSLGLEKLASMNFRRPDRDIPSSVGLDEIYDIRNKQGD